MPNIIILISRNSPINHLLPHECVLLEFEYQTYIGPFSHSLNCTEFAAFLYLPCRPVWFMMLYFKDVSEV